jgi:hypothetical protein
MDYFFLAAFVFLPGFIAIYAAQLLDDRIWRTGYPHEKKRRLAGWGWLGMSILPFATGTALLVFFWLPLLKRPPDYFVNKVVTFIFGAMHFILGLVFVVAGVQYFFKKRD